MSSNYPSQFGNSYGTNHGNQGFTPRGRGRGGQNPRFQRGRGNPNRGGNSTRPPRGRGYQQGYQQQQQNISQYDSKTWQNASSVNEAANQGENVENEDEEQHHFAYEYDAYTEDESNTSYEHMPEYKQSGYGQTNVEGQGDTYQGNTYGEYSAGMSNSDNQQNQQPERQTGFYQQQGNLDNNQATNYNQQAENSGDESEEDTGFCKYCSVAFQTIGAYNAHIRGMQHTNMYMAAKRAKEAKSGSSGAQNYSGSGNFAPTEPQPSTSSAGPSQQQAQPVVGLPAQEEAADVDESSDEEDTGFCKYCKITFTSAKAFHAHTRGLQHTTLVMEAKAKKGDVRFKKEIVSAEVLEVKVPKPRPLVEETRRDEFDIEDNWMNLDGDVINYIKEKKSINNKDLHPEEIGKKVGEDYNCPLCEIYCTGPAAFKSHLEGKAHKLKMTQAEQGVLYRKKKPVVAVAVAASGRPSKLAQLMEDNKTPMLGLEYITEFQKPDFKQLARYVCNLCEAKMDEYAIIPHIIGAKHRMHYLKIAKPHLYDHVTKYSSKKRKSEMNQTIEEFAEDIEKEKGRGEVKVKIEVGEEDDKAELEESMLRAAKELKDKMESLQQKAVDDGEPPAKKGKMLNPPGGREWERDRDRGPTAWGGRDMDPWGPGGRGRGRGWDRDWDRDWDYGRDYGWERDWPPRDMYRRPEYDIMDERRRYDERRYLESQMLDRYRLDDPYLERRRMDDILSRRDYLDRLDRDRIARVEERKRMMEETDPDLLRLRRFADMPSRTAATSEPGKTDDVNYRPSMEELMARRRQNRDFADRIQERPRVDDKLLPTSSSQGPEESLAQRVLATKSVQDEVAKNPSVNVTDLLTKLSSSMIHSEDEAAMALQISSALTQALLTYRLQNAPKELSTLMDSMTPGEAKPKESVIPGFESGTTSTAGSGTSVPSFLKTPASSSGQYAYTSQAGDQSYYYQQTGLQALQTSYQNPYQPPVPAVDQSYMQQTDYSYQAPVSQTGLQDIYAAASRAMSTIHNSQGGLYSTPQPAPQVSPYLSPSQNGSGLQYANASPHISHQSPSSQTGPPHSSVNQSVSSPFTTYQSTTASTPTSVSSLVKDSDKPQKHILDSIRKQTELLKKKIQQATSTAQKGGVPATSVAASTVSGVSPASFMSPGQFANPKRSPQPVQAPAPRMVPPPPTARR